MSQQMEQNERAYQQANYDEGYQGGYHDPFAASSTANQKLSTQTPATQRATSGQRLALAIVSVVMITGLAISIFSSTNLITAGVLAMLMGFLVVLVVGIVLAIINLVFNRR